MQWDLLIDKHGPDVEKCAVGSLGIIENAATSGFPSVVTEGGFLDGSPDASVIANGGVDKYAEGIVEGIDKYFNSDHSGYSSTATTDEKFTSSVESKIINMKYVSQETLQGYIDNGDFDNAIKSFTLDEERNLITVTWSMDRDGNITLKTNSAMDLKTALSKYVMPYEYLLYFFIDSDYPDFSEELADKVMESEIVVAVQDHVTTTKTTNITEQKKVASEEEFSADWHETATETYTTESVSTKVNLTYVSTWCVKTYQENSYSEAVLTIGDAEEKIVEVPGKVRDTKASSLSDEREVERGTRPNGEKDENGNDEMYSYVIYEHIKTETHTISNEYEKGEYKTEGKENIFVELYNKHNMKARVRTSGYIFSIIENNDKTANLLNLTKYLIYKATDVPYGVLEYDFSEYSLESFNNISTGGQIPLYTPVLSREDFIAAMEAYTYNSAYESNFKPNAALIYDTSVQNGINPELVVVTAQTEQSFRAGGGAYNYWGIAVYNGSSTGSSFSSLADGIAGYASVVKSYETGWKAEEIKARATAREAAGCDPLGYGQPGTLSGMQSIYSSVGKHVTGSSGAGGYYYMDPARAGITAIYATHEEFVQKCQNGGPEHAYGTEATTWEQGQYTAFQVKQKIEVWNSIFGAYGSLPGGGSNSEIINIAKKYLGVPYVWGGTTPNGFDCSGFVQYVFAEAGISLPRTTYAYQPYLGSANEVAKEEAQPGDIVWRYSHIGIYLGNDQYIHAPHTGDVVKISSGAMGAFTNVFRFNK